MLNNINDAASQHLQSVYDRGMDCSACMTKRPAFINLVTEGRNDPIVLFKQQPHQTVNAKNLVLHEAQKNLPAVFLQKGLSPEGSKIRTLIGAIYKDVQYSGNAEDIAKLNKICNKLAEANGNEKKEQKVAKELSSLVSKYSAEAFEKVINKFIGHCMEAWEDHHQSKSVDTNRKAIFKQCLDVCKSMLKYDVVGLTQPDQPWETMAQTLNFFVNDCAAISKTLTFYDAEAVTPAPKDLETLNPNHDGGADNQRVFIPTGPGQGGITLNITSQGGSVGDITNSVDGVKTIPADSNSAIVKHILDSGLTDVDKVGLIKDLCNVGIGGGSNFLGNLADVQGYKQVQAVDTPPQNVAMREIETQTPKPELKSIVIQTESLPETETVNDAGLGPEPKVQQQPTIVVEQNGLKTAFDDEVSQTQNTQNVGADNFDDVVLREKKEPSGPLSNGDFIYTTSRNFDPLNRRSSTPTNWISPESETKAEQISGKNVTLAGKFEALQKREPSVFTHLDKNGAVASEEEKAKPIAENDASLGPEPKVQQQPTIMVEQNRLKTAFDDEVSQTQNTQNVGSDNFDNVVLRGKKKPSGPLSNDNYIYTTSRSLDPLNRRSLTPTNLIPADSATKAEQTSGKNVTLAGKFEALQKREPSVFAHLDKNGAVASEEEKAKPNTESDGEQSLTNNLIRTEPEFRHNVQVQSDTSALYRAPASIKTGNPAMDSTDGGMPRKDGEGVSRKSAADGFQPTRINAAAANMPENRSGNQIVYTTVRTVSPWNVASNSVSFVPKDSQFGSTELNNVFSRLKPLEQSQLDALENKRIEQDKERLPVQETSDPLRAREQ